MSKTYRVIDGTNGDPMDKLLLDKFTNPYRKGYVEYAGNILPKVYLKIAEDIENFQVKDSDIWVVSFQKAGTTWTQEMVWLLAQNLDYETANKMIMIERFPFMEMEAIIESYDVDWVPNNTRNSVSYCASMPEPRFIKTHLPWQLLPRQIRTGERKPKIVYVSRDPRDVAVSYYNHVRLLEGYRGNFEEFFDLFIAGKIISTPFWPHVLDVWNERHRSNILFIKYEDMQEDLLSVVRKVANFLGKTYSIDELKGLVKHLSFDNMKNLPSVNFEPLAGFLGKMGLNTGAERFMRSGKTGDFKVHLSKEQLRRINSWCEKNLANTDFTLNQTYETNI